MGYRHSEEEIVDAAAAVALEHGMSGLTYRRVADRLEISDRMVVYYLPTKADLVLAATTAVSVKLQRLLGEAFGDERRDPDALVRKAWPVLTTPAAERIFAIFFEAIGLAAAGSDPYDQLVPAMMQAWLDWLTTRLDRVDSIGTPAKRSRRDRSSRWAPSRPPDPWRRCLQRRRESTGDHASGDEIARWTHFRGSSVAAYSCTRARKTLQRRSLSWTIPAKSLKRSAT